MRARILLALLLLGQLALGAYGIAQRIVWGHAGWHIAEHGASVRNLLAHGTWLPSVWFDAAAPPRNALHFHHPFLLHPYLAASVALFGERPWAFRIVPLAFSLVALIGLYVFTRRVRDERTALLAVALFVLYPVNLAFSHLPDHQIVAIAYTLLVFVGITRWLERPRWTLALAFLAPALLAGLTDWPWYPTAFFTWIVVASRVLRPDASSPFHDVVSRRHGRIVLALFAFVVLATFAQHFLVAWGLGRWDSIQDAFFRRSTRIRTALMLGALWRRDRQLHAVVLPFLAFGWLVWVLRARRRDIGTHLVIALILGETLHLIIFRAEFCLHEYRSYWYVPSCAFALADGARSLGAWWSARHRESAWRRVVPVAMVLVWTASFGGYVWWKSRRTGASVDFPIAQYRPHDDEFLLAAAVRSLRQPGDRFFSAVPGRTDMQLPWLAGSEVVVCANSAPVERVIAKGTSVIVFGDWPALRDAPGWRDVTRGAQVIVLGGAALAIRRPGETASIEVWHRVQPAGHRSAIDAYLHASWLPDPTVGD